MNVWLRMLLVLAAMAPLACDPSGFGSNPGTPSANIPFAGPSAPEDGEGWSILLTMFNGPDHVAAAERCKTVVENEAHWRGMFVFTEGETSTLYWGVYDKPEDAKRDLLTAQAWESSSHNRVFLGAVTLRRPTPNPGNPEWDIRPVFDRAMARATPSQLRNSDLPYYTVVVAEFFNTKEFHNRKQFAADYCADLRKQGYEAYYLHGPTVSKVSIGTYFPRAFATVQQNGVATAAPRDPRMTAIIAKFPYLAVDGYQEYVTRTNEATGRPEKKAMVSYVDTIPGARIVSPPDTTGYPQRR